MVPIRNLMMRYSAAIGALSGTCIARVRLRPHYARCIACISAWPNVSATGVYSWRVTRHTSTTMGDVGMNGGIHDAVNVTDILHAIWDRPAAAEYLDRYERHDAP